MSTNTTTAAAAGSLGPPLQRIETSSVASATVAATDNEDAVVAVDDFHVAGADGDPAAMANGKDIRVADDDQRPGTEVLGVSFYLLFVGLAMAVFLAALDQPIGAVTVLAVVFLLRLPADSASGEPGGLLRGFHRIDWLGTFLLVSAVICLLIPLQGGGTLYAWNSPVVIALFVVGAILLAAFVIVEGWVATQPVVPFSLYRDVRVVRALGSTFFLGGAFFAIIFYSPLWFEVVRNMSATSAGVQIIPLVLGVVVMSIVVGIISTVTGQAYIFIPTSAIPIAVGIGLLSTLTESSPQWTEIVYLLIIGLGVGMSIQTNILVGQATVPIDMLATVTANINFWQTIGGVIALAICSPTFNNVLPVYVNEELSSANQTLTTVPLEALFGSPNLIYSDAISDAQRSPIVHGFVRSFALIFRIAIGFAGGILLTSLFMKKGKLPTGAGASGPAMV
ncbi:hypothetical protein HK405_006472 [Cladochytrium tenue]|nr:hypothetical protein HK405_006472 [Cladochytrium tenue]